MTAASALRAFPPFDRSADRSAALRHLLVERFPDAVLVPDRATPPLATGVGLFDRLLPNGGLPRSRMVTWTTPLGGATAVLRAACSSLLGRGHRVAWVDGARTIGPAGLDGPLIIRPADSALALRSAEILLRSGGFALVVLTGCDPEHQGMLRLSRMVHEGEGSFVALTERNLTATVRVTSRFLLDRFRWATGPFGEVAAVESVAVEITVKASGWSRSAVVDLPAGSHELRLSVEPGLADRRGTLD